jgi:hypothetical protein
VGHGTVSIRADATISVGVVSIRVIALSPEAETGRRPSWPRGTVGVGGGCFPGQRLPTLLRFLSHKICHVKYFVGRLIKTLHIQRSPAVDH